MPTSGLVITATRSADVPGILQEFRNHDCVEAGPPVDLRIPLVTETVGKAKDKELWEWLWGLSGVTAVDVAFIHLHEGTEPSTTDPACSELVRTADSLVPPPL